MTRKIISVAVAAALLLAVLSMQIAPWYPVDDAYISYRYASNWAQGHGPVFNPGERVEGYSNFLFVALVALAARLGVTPPLAGRCVNVAGAMAVLVLLLVALPGRLRHSSARYPAALVFLSSFHTQANVLSGLEAPFAAALALAGALAFESRRPFASPLCLLALSLTRPEGIVLGALLGAADLGRAFVSSDPRYRRRAVLGWALFLAVPYAVYSLWRVVYYGQLLPNSVHAKMGFPLKESLSLSLLYLEPALVSYGPLWVLLTAGCVAWWLHSRRSRAGIPGGGLQDEPLTDRGPRLAATGLWGVLLLGLGILAITLGTGSGDPYRSFLRYFFVSLPLFLVLAVAAVERVRDAARGRLGHLAAASLGLALWLAQIWLVTQPLRANLTRPHPGDRLISGFGMLARQDTRPHLDGPGAPSGLHAAAAWMMDNARDNELLATAEVGTIPYYSGVRVLDTFGLITEHVARLPGRPGTRGDPDYVFGREPDYFVFRKRSDCLCSGIPADVTLFQDPRLRRGYDLVRMFRDGTFVITLFKKRPRHEPVVAYDLCASFAPELVVVRDRDGAALGNPEWARILVGTTSVEIPDEAKRQELLGRFQPAIREEISDFAAAELMREWLTRYGCYLRQLPLPRSRHDLAITYRVAVPERAVLSFTAFLPADPRNQPRLAGDVFFEVAIAGSGGAAATVFKQALPPLEAPVWNKAEIDLGDFSGQEVELSFRVYQERDPASGRTVYYTGWKDVLLLQKEIGRRPEAHSAR